MKSTFVLLILAILVGCTNKSTDKHIEVANEMSLEQNGIDSPLFYMLYSSDQHADSIFKGIDETIEEYVKTYSIVCPKKSYNQYRLLETLLDIIYTDTIEDDCTLTTMSLAAYEANKTRYLNRWLVAKIDETLENDTVVNILNKSEALLDSLSSKQRNFIRTHYFNSGLHGGSMSGMEYSPLSWVNREVERMLTGHSFRS